MAQDDSQPQGKQLEYKSCVSEICPQLAKFSPVPQNQQAEPVQLRLGEAHRVSVVQNIGAVFVVIGV